MVKKSGKKIKSVKKKPVNNGLFGNRLVVFIFVLLFAGAGLVLLLRSYAQTPDPIVLDQVLVEYQKGSLATVEHDANGNVIYPNQPRQTTLLKSGELICNNGSADTVNSVVLSKNDVNSIVSTVSKRLASINKKFGGVPSEDGAEISTSPVSIVLADGAGNVLDSVSTDESIASPPGFNALESYLKNQCAKAARKKPISSLAPTVIPKQEGVAIDITDKLFPKASAATVANSLIAENKSVSMTNNHRTSGTNAYGAPWKHPVGKSALKALPCLKDSARFWSTYMALSGVWGHSKIGELIPHYCGGGWQSLGENIAKGGPYTGDPVPHAEALTRAWFNSLGHHANIDHKNTNGTEAAYQYQELGVGAVMLMQNDGKYVLHMTQHFSRYPNK